MQVEQYIEQLNSWNGYKRQTALENLQECFEPILFPHLLKLLNDYVEINRILACKHLIVWMNLNEISDLCVTYFLDIKAASYRSRTSPYMIADLLEQLNIKTARHTILSKQGKLSRALYFHLKENNKISKQDLLELAQHTYDQYIRHDWKHYLFKQNIDFIQQHFFLTKHIEIKKSILEYLLKTENLNNTILLEALKHPKNSLRELATFALKKQNFDFSAYIFTCTSNQLKALLISELNYNQAEFFDVLLQIKNRNVLFSILFRAIKVNYISPLEFVNFLKHQCIQISVKLLNRCLTTLKLNVYCINILYQLCTDKITLEHKLNTCSKMVFWDKLDWVTQLCCNENQQNNQLLLSIESIIKDSRSQYYPPTWKKETKLKCKNNFEHTILVLKLKLKYPTECKKILEKLI